MDPHCSRGRRRSIWGSQPDFESSKTQIGLVAAGCKEGSRRSFHRHRQAAYRPTSGFSMTKKFDLRSSQFLLGLTGAESEPQLFVAGLDRIATLSNRGLQNLTLVVLRSISDWKRDWRNTRLNKEEGQSHSVLVQSFLSWAISRLPWLWSGEGGASREHTGSLVCAGCCRTWPVASVAIT